MPQKRIKKDKFEPKDLVLAKMHGFPAWPSFVMPLNLVPEPILRAKKKTTNFCVIFIPDGDFYWMNEKSLDILTEEALDKKLDKIPAKYVRKKGNGGRTLHVNDALLAAKGLDFDEFMEQLDKDRGGNEEEEEEEEEDDEEEEEEEVQEETFVEDESKQTNEDDDTNNKEEDENNKISKEESNGEELEEEDEEEEEEATSRQARNLKRSRRLTPVPSKRTKVKSDQPSTPTNGSSPRPKKKEVTSSPKVTTNEERQHQLWLCRIKLQRTLIQRNQPVTPTDPKKFPPPTADELLVARLILHRLADFPMTVDFLRSTKIHKVLKCILRNRDLEYSDSFKLHEKCDELLSKWSEEIDKLRIEKLNETKRDEKVKADESETSGIDSIIPLKNGNSHLDIIEGISVEANT